MSVAKFTKWKARVLIDRKILETNSISLAFLRSVWSPCLSVQHPPCVCACTPPKIMDVSISLLQNTIILLLELWPLSPHSKYSTEKPTTLFSGLNGKMEIRTLLPCAHLLLRICVLWPGSPLTYSVLASIWPTVGHLLGRLLYQRAARLPQFCKVEKYFVEHTEVWWNVHFEPDGGGGACL